MPNTTPYVGPMGQTRVMSLVEAVTSILLALVIGLVLRWYVLPVFGVSLDDIDNFGWLLAFSAFAVVRTYVVRRLFEAMR